MSSMNKLPMIFFFLFFLVFGADISSVEARFVVAMKIVSGKIIRINTDQSIELDDSVTYLPSWNGIHVTGVQAGDAVTVKYFVDQGEKKFVEYVKGRNAIREPLPVSPRSMNGRF